jgi:hypothetical protein
MEGQRERKELITNGSNTVKSGRGGAVNVLRQVPDGGFVGCERKTSSVEGKKEEKRQKNEQMSTPFFASLKKLMSIKSNTLSVCASAQSCHAPSGNVGFPPLSCQSVNALLCPNFSPLLALA